MIVPVEIIQQQVQLLSQDCGVYIFRDSTERVLYVGKAKHLKTRLLQYVQGHDGRPMVDRLLKKAVKIDITLTQTEKEALIVEATLIKKYQPPFNVRLKSGGQYMYVMIDHRHENRLHVPPIRQHCHIVRLNRTHNQRHGTSMYQQLLRPVYVGLLPNVMVPQFVTRDFHSRFHKPRVLFEHRLG